MGRILFFVGLGIVLYALFRVIREDFRKKKVEKSSGKTIAMIACPECKTHFPENEAVIGRGVKYCCEACRKKAQKKKIF